MEARDAARQPAVCGTAPTIESLSPKMSLVLRVRHPTWGISDLGFGARPLGSQHTLFRVPP